jgi:hypothetical protein
MTASTSRPATASTSRPALTFAALLALCGTLALSVGACGRSADTARTDSAAEAARAPISDTLTGAGTREGTWQGAEARSTWRAVLDGPQVTQLDEVALFTDSTRAMRQFRFDSTGALASAREERSQTVYGNRATPDTVNTIIELEWQADSLARSAKRVNGVDRLLQPYEVDNIRAHAAELLRTARAGSSAGLSGRTP